MTKPPVPSASICMTFWLSIAAVRHFRNQNVARIIDGPSPESCCSGCSCCCSCPGCCRLPGHCLDCRGRVFGRRPTAHGAAGRPPPVRRRLCRRRCARHRPPLPPPPPVATAASRRCRHAGRRTSRRHRSGRECRRLQQRAKRPCQSSPALRSGLRQARRVPRSGRPDIRPRTSIG